MAARKPRLSLTKTQIRAGVGAELLALCQSVTADGVLTDGEIAELNAWLDAHRASDLPAIAFLVATLERILADGKVTPGERRELYGAVETVLPPEARQAAAGRRRAVEAEESARARHGREAQEQTERDGRERRAPLCSVNFVVAGVHYEGRGEVIGEYAEEGERVFLARDPHNRFSPNAIEVRLRNGMQIGFVPEDYAPEVAPLLDGGCPHAALITKILRGGRVPIPVVQAYVYRADAGVEGLVFPADVPAKQLQPGRTPFQGLGEPRRSPAKAGRMRTVLIAAVPLAWALTRLI